MNREENIEGEIQFTQVEPSKLTLKQEAVPLRQVIKKVLIDMYARGIIPKEVTQKLYNLLKLKEM